MRTFTLVRNVDVTGVSGTGLVAEGVQFTDGTVVMRWLTTKASTVVWSNIEDAMEIHGHNGQTELLWTGPQ